MGGGRRWENVMDINEGGSKKLVREERWGEGEGRVLCPPPPHVEDTWPLIG